MVFQVPSSLNAANPLSMREAEADVVSEDLNDFSENTETSPETQWLPEDLPSEESLASKYSVFDPNWIDEWGLWPRTVVHAKLGLSSDENWDLQATAFHNRLATSPLERDRRVAELMPYPDPNNEYTAKDYLINRLNLNEDYLGAVLAEAGTAALSTSAGLGAFKLTGEALKTLSNNPYLKFGIKAGTGLTTLSFTDTALRDLIEDGFYGISLDPNKNIPGVTVAGTAANIFGSTLPASAFIAHKLGKIDGPISFITDKLRLQRQLDDMLAGNAPLSFGRAQGRSWHQAVDDKFRSSTRNLDFNARSLAGSIVNDMAKQRKERPLEYWWQEGSATTFGAAGASAATHLAPGEVGTEMASEMGASLVGGLMPTSKLVGVLPYVGSSLWNFANSPIEKTKEGAVKAIDFARKKAKGLDKATKKKEWNNALEYIDDLLLATGEDPADIAERIITNPIVWVGDDGRVLAELNPQYPGIDPEDPKTWPYGETVHFLRAGNEEAKQTVFHLTNSKAMGILQELLERGKYGTAEQAVALRAANKEAVTESLNTLNTLTGLLLSTGDPDDLRNALLARELVIDNWIQDLINTQTRRAQDAAEKAGVVPVITPGTDRKPVDPTTTAPGEGTDLLDEATLLKRAASDALSRTREIERKLYEGLSAFELQPTNLHRAFLSIAEPNRAEIAGAPVYTAGAVEPIYGPEGSYDAGEIIGYRKTKPSEKHVDEYGQNNDLLPLYQRIAQREETREISAVLSQDEIIQQMRDDGITRTNTDPDEYVRIRDEEYGWKNAPREGTQAQPYIYGEGLDDPFLAARMGIVNIDENTGTMNITELMAQRTKFLEKAKNLRAESKHNTANVYAYLAKAIQKDLIDYESRLLGVERLGKPDSPGSSKLIEWDDLTDAEKATVQDNFYNLSEPQQRIIIANQFSRRLNDSFSRTFSGELLQVDRMSRDLMQPEDIINSLDQPNILKEHARQRQFKEAIRRLVLPEPEDGVYDPRAIYDSFDQGVGSRLQIGEDGRLIIQDPNWESSDLNAAMQLADQLRTMESAYDFVLQGVLANKAADPLDPSVFSSLDTSAMKKRMQKIQEVVDVIFPGSTFAQDFRNAKHAAVKLSLLKSKQANLNKLKNAEAGILKLANIRNPAIFFDRMLSPDIQNAKGAYQEILKFAQQLKNFEDNFFPKRKLAEMGISIPNAKRGLLNVMLKNLLKNAGNKVNIGDNVSFTPESLGEFSRMMGYSVVKRGEDGAPVLEANIPFGNVEGARPLVDILEDMGLMSREYRSGLELLLSKTEMLRQDPRQFLALAPEDPFSEWLNNLAGIGGAITGRQVSNVVPQAGTIQTPGIVAKLFRKLVNLVPGSEGANVLFDIAHPENREQLVTMLKSIKELRPERNVTVDTYTPISELERNKVLTNFLYKGLYPYLNKAFSPGAISAGMQVPFTEVGEGKRHPITSEEADVIEKSIQEVEGPPLGAVSPDPVKVRPIERPLTMLPRPEIQPPQPQPRSMGPASPPTPPTPDRMRFAGLFPEDITSGLIRQGAVSQGIGSLAG